jgi:hypothetical protein
MSSEERELAAGAGRRFLHVTHRDDERSEVVAAGEKRSA